MPITDPTDITGCVVWQDAKDISTLWQNTAGTTPVASTGDSILRWDNKGSGNNLVNSSGSDYLRYSSDYQSTGHPFVTADEATFGAQWLQWAAGLTVSQPFTLSGVFYFAGGGGNDAFVYGSSSAGDCNFQTQVSSSSVFVQGGSGSNIISANAAQFSTKIRVLALLSGASTFIETWDGTTLRSASGTTGGEPLSTAPYIGRTRFGTGSSNCTGGWGELVIHSGDITGGTDQDDLEAYYEARWFAPPERSVLVAATLPPFASATALQALAQFATTGTLPAFTSASALAAIAAAQAAGTLPALLASAALELGEIPIDTRRYPAIRGNLNSPIRLASTQNRSITLAGNLNSPIRLAGEP